MRKPLSGIFLLAVASGCATAGQQAEPPVIPVYEYVESVPCEHENIQRIHHRMTVVVRSGKHYKQIRDRELAKLGATVGADGVVVTERDPDRPLTLNIETPMNAIFEGMAYRCVDNR